MEHVEIPGTDLRVSRIGLGTWSIGGWMWGGTDEEEAVRTIHASVDKGVDLIDTAPVYGFGRAEEIVGRALAQANLRQKVFISTKVGLDWTDGEVFRNSSDELIRQNLEDSLRRLKTDYVDILFVHWPDPAVPFEETARTMSGFLRDGRVRAVGVSNYSPAQMEEFRRGGPIHVCQPPYNLFEREIERDLMPHCEETDVALMVYGPLCRGLLSGRVTADRRFGGDDLRQEDPKFQQPRLGQYLEAVERLDRLASERYGKGVLHLAVRWVLDRGCQIALWGGRKPEQMEPVEEVLGWRLDEEAVREIDGILQETVKDPVGPEFMAPPSRDQL